MTDDDFPPWRLARKSPAALAGARGSCAVRTVKAKISMHDLPIIRNGCRLDFTEAVFDGAFSIPGTDFAVRLEHGDDGRWTIGAATVMANGVLVELDAGLYAGRSYIIDADDPRIDWERLVEESSGTRHRPIPTDLLQDGEAWS